MKKLLIAVSSLALIVILTLSVCLVSANKRIERVKAGRLIEIHSALRDLETYLPQWSENPSSARLTAYLQRSLTKLDVSIRAAEILYDQPIYIMTSGLDGFGFIAECLSDFSTQINDTVYRGVMFDGYISDAEHEYISRLITALSELHAPILADDGLNILNDARYDDIRAALVDFIKLWGYNYEPDAPIALLTKG